MRTTLLSYRYAQSAGGSAVLCIGGDFGSGDLKLEKDFTKLTAGMQHFRRRGKEVYSLHGG